jgi:23S rRNA (cytosine1962-C5)-methyltransferase
VTPAAERAIRAGHPWLFDGGIRRLANADDAAPGDLAALFDGQRRFLAIGLYDPDAPIRVRVLHAGEPQKIDAAWFAHRVDAALARRHGLLPAGTDGYRLIHGENDGLPGLVADRYRDTLVMQLDTAAWIPHLRHVLPALLEAFPDNRFVLRLSRSLHRQPTALFGLTDGQVLHGPPLDGPVLFHENRLQFLARVRQGQKTGFFLDQRDNRARVERLAAGQRILNVFAYSGGFSVYAGRGGAREVLSIDLNEAALADAQRHFDLNGPEVAKTKHRVWRADAFGAMAELAERQERYEMAILDPPSFARRQSDVPAALAAYRRLAALGAQLLAPAGVLVSASCSSRVTADAFYAAVHEGVAAAGRRLEEMARTGQPPDHPIGFPEGAYLKCLFARVV